jgi:hypothetical protein
LCMQFFIIFFIKKRLGCDMGHGQPLSAAHFERSL